MKQKPFVEKTALVYVLVTMLSLAWIVPTAAMQTITLDVGGGHWNEDIRTWLETDALPRFTELTDIAVEVRYSTGDDRQRLLLAHATGLAPDVMSTALNHAKFWAAPLDKYFESWEERDDYVPALMETARYNGDLLIIPYSVSMRHFYYRKDMFAEAGLSAEAVPATWENLLEVVQRLIRFDGDEIVQYPLVTDGEQWMFESLYYQAGGKRYSVVPSDADWPEYQPSLRVYEYLEELYHGAYPGSEIQRFSSESRKFRDGNAAISFSQSGNVNAIFSTMDPDLFGSLPAFSMTEGSRRVAVNTNRGLAISTDSKQPEAAWELVKFLSEVENAATYNSLRGTVPTRISVLTGAGGYDAPLGRVVAQLLPHTLQSFLTEFSGMGPINSIMRSEAALMFAGDKAPSAAVESLRAQVKALQQNATK